MKRLFPYLLLLALVSEVWAEVLPPLPQTQVVKLNDHVYALLGPLELPTAENRGYMVNSAVILGEKGVILVDTGFSHEIGEHLKQAVKTITNKPVTHIINTHDHGDHVLGNNAFPGATIISSEQCKSVMEKTGYEWIGILEQTTGRTYPNTKPVVAGKGYAPGVHKQVMIDGVNLTLWVPPGSHTATDMLVYLPQDRILISGDVLENQLMPSFRDANVKNWIGTLQKIGTMQISNIIPGHGPLMQQADVKQMLNRMQTFYAGVEAGYKQGLTDGEIRKQLDLTEWKKLKYFDEFIGLDVNRTYLEVEAANF
ncbi:MAG: MBL fold metallo-hydrolase [Gammaproteobacteria bacterium]|nr:MBL fold metallo-hydrolase [Gammaproteobacteria bacterium]